MQAIDDEISLPPPPEDDDDGLGTPPPSTPPLEDEGSAILNLFTSHMLNIGRNL